MKKLLILLSLSLTVLVLSGCNTLTLAVTEENSSSYNTWELCTLLYRPHQMYSDWVVDEGENKTMETELKKRGIYDEESCDIVELSKTQCIEFGYKKDTQDFVDCTGETFRDINDKIITTKENREKEKSNPSSSSYSAINSFLQGFNSGLSQNPPYNQHNHDLYRTSDFITTCPWWDIC